MKESNFSAWLLGFLFPTAITIVFLILKLTGLVSWSWWWIFSPLWIFVTIMFVICLFVLVLVLARLKGNKK